MAVLLPDDVRALPHAPLLPPAARAVRAVKVHGTGDTAVRALDGADVVFDSGRFTAIIGSFGFGEVHPLALPGGAGHAHVGLGPHRRDRPRDAP